MHNQSSNVMSENVSAVSATSSKLVQLGSALLLGVVIVSGAGFMNMPAAHNAAHDMRHSQGFPCH